MRVIVLRKVFHIYIFVDKVCVVALLSAKVNIPFVNAMLSGIKGSKYFGTIHIIQNKITRRQQHRRDSSQHSSVVCRVIEIPKARKKIGYKVKLHFLDGVSHIMYLKAKGRDEERAFADRMLFSDRSAPTTSYPN